MLFQSMGRGQYRSTYDREMYLQHLQLAHGVRISQNLGSNVHAAGEVQKE